MTDMRRPHADHAKVAARLRACPRCELPVGTYGSRASAQVTASHIRSGALPAYQPAGCFEARFVLAADRTGWTVHATYTGNTTTERGAR